MVGIGIAIGVIVIIIGAVLSTDHIDNMYRNRHRTETTPMKPLPVFITSDTQCRDCGIDGDLLNLAGRCRYCHELAHA